MSSPKVLFADDQIPLDEIPDSQIRAEIKKAHPDWDDRYEGVIEGFVGITWNIPFG